MERPRLLRSRASLRATSRAVFAALLAKAWPDRPSTWRGMVVQIRPHTSQIIRLTLAAVFAYLVIRILFPSTNDVTGPLTALLVVQASSVGTLQMGVLRVGAVLTGILVAVGVSSYVGLSWWSIGLVVALALLVATVLRLGDQLLEAPISAMLILSASAADTASETRLGFTLLGALVGIVMALVLPPSLPVSLASIRVRGVADQLADLLSSAAESLAQQPVTRAKVDEWTTALRGISDQVDVAAETIDRVSESRRLNTRAILFADVAPLLRSGLSTLENCVLAVLALFVQIRYEVPDVDESGDPQDDDLRAVFAVVLHHSSAAIRGFGELAEAEADGRQAEAVLQFSVSLEMLREARAILDELMLTDGGSRSWLLRTSTLNALEQVLAQLDLDSRSKVREEWEQAQARRLGAHLPVLVRDALPQPEKPLPKLVERGLKEVVNPIEHGRRIKRGSRWARRFGREVVDVAVSLARIEYPDDDRPAQPGRAAPVDPADDAESADDSSTRPPSEEPRAH